MKRVLAALVLVAIASIWLLRASAAPPVALAPAEPRHAPTKEERSALGALAFSDTALSTPPGESCATCHDPKRAFSDSRGTPTSEGAIRGRFGPRNAPSLAYASLTPNLVAAGAEGFTGGHFWDGRADTLEAQVKGPLLNPLEMNNADAGAVVAKLRAAPYASQFRAVYGEDALDDTDKALGRLADAIAAYEATFSNRFTSKYDRYLAGSAQLTPAEQRGLRLFENDRTGPCTQCHLDKPGADGTPPLFTDFGYDNLGIPHNAENPFYRLPSDLNPEGPNGVDPGLGAITHARENMGQFKAPTLRNVAITAPYGHNGYFKTLKEVVHFYNTRDVAGAWFPPEHKRGMNIDAMGSLRLTDDEENDLVAFMEALTDAP